MAPLLTGPCANGEVDFTKFHLNLAHSIVFAKHYAGCYFQLRPFAQEPQTVKCFPQVSVPLTSTLVKCVNGQKKGTALIGRCKHFFFYDTAAWGA